MAKPLPTIVMVMVMAVCMTGCKSVESQEQTTDYRHIARLTERMDSMMRSTSTWQQSLFEKQTSLVDSFKKSEVRDTSHTIFLGAKGDTIKETIIIREFIEREHSSQESTQELREEFFRQTDSILQANRQLSEKVDSALHSHNKETVVEKQEPWYERLFNGVRNICAIFGVLGLVFFLIFQKEINP